MTNSDYPDYESNDDFLIRIGGMGIKNDRNKSDIAYLHSSSWSGMLVGTDGYPVKDEAGNYCIGSKTLSFKPTAIEFYGIKTND